MATLKFASLALFALLTTASANCKAGSYLFKALVHCLLTAGS